MAFGKCDSCATLREVLDAERIRYTELFAAYEKLRLVSNPAEERKGLAPAERSLKAADQAIETQMERWGNNPLLRKRLQRYVHEQRIKNVEEDTIAHSVLHWGDPEEESA